MLNEIDRVHGGGEFVSMKMLQVVGDRIMCRIRTCPNLLPLNKSKSRSGQDYQAQSSIYMMDGWIMFFFFPAKMHGKETQRCIVISYKFTFELLWQYLINSPLNILQQILRICVEIMSLNFIK